LALIAEQSYSSQYQSSLFCFEPLGVNKAAGSLIKTHDIRVSEHVEERHPEKEEEGPFVFFPLVLNAMLLLPVIMV
jgi:hypothetical protein